MLEGVVITASALTLMLAVNLSLLFAARLTGFWHELVRNKDANSGNPLPCHPFYTTTIHSMCAAGLRSPSFSSGLLHLESPSIAATNIERSCTT